jgi:hypothetical protein
VRSVTHHQHDVHDDDAADNERQGDDPDENGEDAAGRRPVEAEHRIRIENSEVVFLRRLQPPCDPHRECRVVDVRFNLFEVSRLDRHRQLAPRAEHLLKLPQRNDRELVHRLAERLSSPGADADDAEMESLDLDDFVDRIDIRPEQPFGELRADHGRAPVHGDFRGADEPPSLGVVAREIDVFGSNARHLDAVDRRIAVRSPAQRACELNITADTSALYRLTASASCRVMRGFDCTRSHSSSLRTMPNCWTMKESAPASLRMACLTDALRP